MRPKTSSTERPVEGMTLEDIKRELGLADLSHDACVRELFGDLLDEALARATSGSAKPSTNSEIFRVTQTGPGRRNSSPKQEE